MPQLSLYQFDLEQQLLFRLAQVHHGVVQTMLVRGLKTAGLVNSHDFERGHHDPIERVVVDLGGQRVHWMAESIVVDQCAVGTDEKLGNPDQHVPGIFAVVGADHAASAAPLGREGQSQD